jgi:hypothetical protein
MAGVVDKSEFFHYKNLLFAKQQELSTGKSLVGSIPMAGEPHGDPIDLAAGETSATPCRCA